MLNEVFVCAWCLRIWEMQLYVNKHEAKCTVVC